MMPLKSLMKGKKWLGPPLNSIVQKNRVLKMLRVKTKSIIDNIGWIYIQVKFFHGTTFNTENAKASATDFCQFFSFLDPQHLSQTKDFKSQLMVLHLIAVHHQPKESAIIYQIGKIVKQFSFRLQNIDFKISKVNNNNSSTIYYYTMLLKILINCFISIQTQKSQKVEVEYKIKSGRFSEVKIIFSVNLMKLYIL